MAHETPTEVAWDIGRQYVENLYPPLDPGDERAVRRAFDVMAERNRELFDAIPVPVVFQSDDPYGDYTDMQETTREEDILRVFSGGEPHPIWDHNDELRARAVHDWFGHLRYNVDFSPSGEYLKWHRCRDHYPAHCERVFFTEVVGQLGAVHYLDDGFASDRFEQKVFPAPPEWIERMSRAVEAEHGTD